MRAPRHSPRPAPIPPTRSRAPGSICCHLLAPGANGSQQGGPSPDFHRGGGQPPFTCLLTSRPPARDAPLSPSEPDPLQGRRLRPRWGSRGARGSPCHTGSAVQDTQKASPPPPTALPGRRGLAEPASRARGWSQECPASQVGTSILTWPWGQRGLGEGQEAISQLRLEDTRLGWETRCGQGWGAAAARARSPALLCPGPPAHLDRLCGLPGDNDDRGNRAVTRLHRDARHPKLPEG